MHSSRSQQCALGPDILSHLIARGSAEVREAALNTMRLDHSFRLTRAEASAATVPQAATFVTFARIGGRPQRNVAQQANEEVQTPGVIARAEGQPVSGDDAVDAAYQGFGAVYDFYWTVFQRDSLDGQGMPIVGGVHFGRNYQNAFYDGAGHMFFGDGDGAVLTQTAHAMDLIAHELTHAVIQYDTRLAYSGQSGALNESLADVMGSLAKQFQAKQTADQANWLIGETVVGPEMPGAIRSLKAPGTANPVDNQVATMDQYVQTSLDSGGVHRNSGIANHAFYVTATTLGGNAWEAPGRIWYQALHSPQLHQNCTFTDFAQVTLTQAQRLYGESSAEAQAVRTGWEAAHVPLAAS